MKSLNTLIDREEPLARRMKTRIGFAATLTLAVALALGPTGTPAAAAAENAVVHWSGIAEGAIAASRPPASSSVLAGMVHGAMYDAVAAIQGGLAPFATSVTPPSGASADAAVAQAARESLSPASRLRRRPCRPPTTPTWR